jgi:hypothetical protein
VRALPFQAFDETMFWIAEHRALVPGDRLIGSDAGLALCPQSWLRYIDPALTIAELREALGVLRELDVELVLVSHGEPVLTGAAAALSRALDAR